MIRFLKVTAPALLLLATNSAIAGLITTNTPGYTMSDFIDPTAEIGFNVGDSISFATSVNGDTVNFMKKNESGAQDMTIGQTPSWWSGVDSDFYFAPVSGSGSVRWLELIMPENTLGFSLSLDASQNARAWIVGVDNDGNGIDTSGNAFSLQNNGNLLDINGSGPEFNIDIGPSVPDPLQTYGFYADNSAHSCNTISKVVIDPTFWGMGDFKIHVGDNPCGEVSEPSVLLLFVAGFFGLGYARRKIRS